MADALATRVLTAFEQWRTWLTTNGATGYVGEVGWPWDSDLGGWNKLAEEWYDAADASNIWVTAWSSGRWWAPTYNLARYVNGAGDGVLNTAKPSTVVSERHQTTVNYRRGTNLNGAEFGGNAIVGGGVFSNVNPGTVNFDFVYPTLADFQYLAARGVNVVRFSFKWERIQPTLGGPLNAAELARLHAAVDAAAAAGIGIILSPYNFARYWSGTDANTRTELVMQADGGALNAAHFSDLWTRLSAEFKNDPAVVAYGLMNEPHSLAPVAGGFTGTNRYTWNASVEGWTAQTGETLSVSTTTAHEGAGSLRVTKAVAGGGSYRDSQIRGPFYPTSPPTGNAVRVWVYLDASSPTGPWYALPWWQEDGTGTVHTADGGGVALNAGWNEVVGTFAANPIPTNTDLLAFGLTVYGNPANAGTLAYNVDEHAQGDATGATGAEVWEDCTQRVITALRSAPASDTKLVMVPGYGYSAVEGWATRHPNGWITDPAANFRYEAHQYWDVDASGTYAETYEEAARAAVAAGHAGGLPNLAADGRSTTTGTATFNAPPVVLSRTVNGATVTIVHDRPLNPAFVTQPWSWTVKVNGATRAVTAVSLTGATVTLTLASPAGTGDTVTVTYSLASR